MSPVIRPDFDVFGPLPTGTTVLEASAGTGKTYTIAALTARYIAEGHAELSQLLLVTFGRMATNELRARVRERLVGLEARLAYAVTGALDAGAVDDVEHVLLDADPAELGRRHARVSRALTDFDAATIATTHEFCLQMLDGLGVLGDREPGATFVEQLGDLTREVATDLYLQRYASGGDAPVTYPEALLLADAGVSSVHAELAPDAVDGSLVAERVAFTAAVRVEVERRKRHGRLFTYDDQLSRLRDALADPVRGPAAAARLQARYRVVMVDEFQDTDPVQWDILKRAFHQVRTLILIGDPKQAIYGFRGADVFSYLDAVAEADHVATLGKNRRSDAAVVDALGLLLGQTALGDERIRVWPVSSEHPRRLRSSHTVPPVRIRVIEHAAEVNQVPPVARLRDQIKADLVADVTALLASGAEVAVNGHWRPIHPADIAILVRRNERGEALRDALTTAGVPAVLHGATSVFDSAVAQDWLTLLTTLEQPRQSGVRQAALTCFLGWTFADLAGASDDALIELTQRVRGWSRTLAARGVAALLETISVQTRFPERLLGTPDGERTLTDLRHLAQSLHAAMSGGQLGVSALAEWLRGRISEARKGSAEGTRRLETDAQAVSIWTVHRSKGLEFPVVYLPEAWDRFVKTKDSGGTLSLHRTDPQGRSVRLLDVGGSYGPGRAERLTQQRSEESGEDLRLLYVGLTRAQCQVVTWWAPSVNTPSSALQRLLYRPTTEEVAQAYGVHGDPLALPSLVGIALEPVRERTPTPWQPAAALDGPLRARRFSRALDLDWRRTSYSALTAAAHGVPTVLAGVGSEPPTVRDDDETTLVDPAAVVPPTERSPDGSEEAGLNQHSPMADLGMGADFGTAVHAVFETTDPGAPDLRTALVLSARAVLNRSATGSLTAEELAEGLLPVYHTSLGPLAGRRRLVDIPLSDQLSELGFEIGLAGGDQAFPEGARSTLGQIVPLLRRHLSPADPLAAYAAELEHPALAEQSLRGYLTGSIDAVLRVRDGAGDPSYLVVDYKTNWLGSSDGSPLTLRDYQPANLTAAMIRAHYPLQALLYSVAVHRMLRWRQPDYDPHRHLGGVLYLFVRGMAGPQTPQFDEVPCGVFSWRPPSQLILDLSDLLDGAAT